MSKIFRQMADGTIKFKDTIEATEWRKKFESQVAQADKSEMMEALLKAFVKIGLEQKEGWRETRERLIEELGLPPETNFSYGALTETFQILEE